MRNVNKSPKIRYSATVRKMQKWSISGTGVPPKVNHVKEACATPNKKERKKEEDLAVRLAILAL